ncbi:MAG: hypothetical protein IJS63_04875, partial [Bacteroidaceae bacterium]|nr:hypothetical protein [Bacteroidaceae bacterium]
CYQEHNVLSPLQGFILRRIINGGSSLRSGAGGDHPRLSSIVSSRLSVSPIPYIIAQMLVHKRKERLCVHFYRTAMIIFVSLCSVDTSETFTETSKERGDLMFFCNV